MEKKKYQRLLTSPFPAIASTLRIQSLNDWYKVTTRTFESHGGHQLLKKLPPRHRNLVGLLAHRHPHHTWLPWKFPQVPEHYWDDKANQLKFIEWAGSQLQVKTLEDWYSIASSAVKALGGTGLLNRKHNGSLPLALQELYPAHAWIPWKFDIVPKGFWTVKENRRRFFAWLFGQPLTLSSMQDWYNISPSIVNQYGGAAFFKRVYGGSLAKALLDLFPEHTWLPWKFSNHSVEETFWDFNENRRLFIQHIEDHLNISSIEDWSEGSKLAALYRAVRSIPSLAKYMSSQYQDSIVSLMKDFYASSSAELTPNALDRFQVWEKEFKNSKALADFPGPIKLLSREQRMEYVNKILAPQLGITKVEDWYQVTNAHLETIQGAQSMIRHWYGGSLLRCLQDTVEGPESGKWLTWKFDHQAPRGFWQNEKSRKEFFDTLAKQFNLSSLQDWYQIDAQRVINAGGTLASCLNGLGAYFCPRRNTFNLILRRIISSRFEGHLSFTRLGNLEIWAHSQVCLGL